MRLVALGRKNWLFVGSERGGHAAALYMSLIKSCKNCDVNPWEYLNDMHYWIMGHTVSKLRELLPDQWKPRLDSLRDYSALYPFFFSENNAGIFRQLLYPTASENDGQCGLPKGRRINTNIW
jgi:hypothetical protein